MWNFPFLIVSTNVLLALKNAFVFFIRKARLTRVPSGTPLSSPSTTIGFIGIFFDLSATGIFMGIPGCCAHEHCKVTKNRESITNFFIL